MEKPQIILICVILAFLLVWPFIGPEYQIYLTLSIFGYSVALLGLNLLFNYTGLLSFGHALFIGFGGYTAAFLTSKYHIFHMEIALLAAIVLAAVIGTLIGMICVRYIKIYFAMLTLAFGMLFHSFLIKTYYLTGGDEGMPVLQPSLLGMDFSSMDPTTFLIRPFYFYSLGILVLASIVMWRIVHSPFGLCIQSIRDNPDKAKYLGVGIRKYRLFAFVISGCFTAVGGVLLAPVTGHMDPGMVFWTHSGEMVFMTLLGGFTNFFGPMLGSVVFIFLRDEISSVTQYWRLIFGALLAAIVILAPGGIIEVIWKSFGFLKKKVQAGD
ncbi:MAG: branched-chain amino acid ABC transporter permease [Desulfobacterales bacterium]|nr:MAG: branched-chain amino acid ABC transporter permease [Desulfobacterales bacterium]